MADEGARCIVIGIGNPDRGDDAAGRAVARWLRGKLPPNVELVEHDGEATTLMSCFEGVGTAYLIDACSSAKPAGRVQRFDAGAAPLPQDAFSLSSHGLGLAEAVELARALGQLPELCIVYAIEGESFATGAPLSPAVATAVGEAGEGIRSEICGATAPGDPVDA